MSASPGSVIADLTVDLERPRKPEMATSDGFVELKKQCLGHIRAESLKAFEQVGA
jgi:NitT/TauT family transport system ATP-binding protein